MASKNGSSCLQKVVSLADLATLLVLSERSVQRLVKQAVIKLARNKAGQLLRGRFVLGEAVPALVEHLRDSVLDDPNEKAYSAARAQRMQALAVREELDTRLRTGQLIERSQVALVLAHLATATKSAVLALPNRLMHQIANKNAAEANAILRIGTRACLHKLAHFDVRKLEQTARSARRKNGQQRDDDDAA
jgi:phage terminase Nu1 subunit (DNA packaging protein)